MTTLLSKLARLRASLADPDALRRFICNRFPNIPGTSRLLPWLYPAWWKYRLYLWTLRFAFAADSLENNNTNRYLVRVPNLAGIGDQIVTSWSEAYMLAQKHGLTFTHHPFVQNPHSPNVDWENFLQFGEGEVAAASVLADKRLKKVFLPPLVLSSRSGQLILSRLINKVYRKDNIVFHLPTGVYLESDIDQAKTMPAVYREKYRNARRLFPVELSFDDEHLHIAVHLRRGDVASLKQTHPAQWSNRWIDTSYYVHVLNDLLSVIRRKRVQIHLYSDGTKEELATFESFPNTKFHLQDNPLQTFHELISADILIVSSSAFSICAGKISENIKIISEGFDKPDFRLFIPKTGDWVMATADGNLPSESKQRIFDYLRH